jgi:hypothetical protein
MMHEVHQKARQKKEIGQDPEHVGDVLGEKEKTRDGEKANHRYAKG